MLYQHVYFIQQFMTGHTPVLALYNRTYPPPMRRQLVDITRAAGTAATLTEMAVSCSLPEKDELLYYFALQHPGRTLVFCNRCVIHM